MAHFTWQRVNGTAALAVLAIMLIGCAPSRPEQRQSRLEQFRTLLPEPARRDFDAKRYEDVVLRVDSVLAVDPGFARRWDDMKKREAIGLFTTTEVVHYFVVYFVSYRGDS